MKPGPPPVLDALDQLIASTPEEKIPALVVALLVRAGALAGRQLVETGAPQRAVQQPDENLSVAEAARRLGVSRDWLYRHSGELPFTIRIGRRVVFSARGLEQWSRKQQGLNHG
jgi:excisionase family DNA binding protein